MFTTSTNTMTTILTVAVTGAVTTREQTPYLPVTPTEIATSVLESIEAGASIVHIHVRDPATGRASMATELYEDVVNQIRKEQADAIINLTTGPGSTGPASTVIDHTGAGIDPKTIFKRAEDRVQHILKIKPEICSLDLNTMNRGVDRITVNTIDTARRMLTLIKDTGTKPELELFDSGDVHIALELMRSGHLPENPLWQICLGVKWGWEPTPETLLYAKNLLPSNTTWSAFGVGRGQMPMVAQSWLLGGHVRVGLEDNIYLEKGVLAKTNAELVTKAANIVNNLGGKLATIKQSRQILGLPQ